jgi:hypothetical protein
MQTIKMMDEDESEEIISDNGNGEEIDNEIFINREDIQSNDKIDEDLRTIIVKRVKEREIQFNNLSLGDDFIETFAEQLKKDHNIHKILLNNNRLTSRGAMAVMNKVSNSTNWLDLSNNPEIRLDAYKFLSKYILQDYRK